MTEESLSRSAGMIEDESLRDQILGFRESVFLLCLGFAHDEAAAQDLVQETYLKALAHLDDAPAGLLKPWLLRIARNNCLDRERRQKVRRLFLPYLVSEVAEWKTPEDDADEREQIAMVRRAIRRLPRRQRDVLVMREYGELSYQEIAQVLQISEGTVMSRLNRARQGVLRLYREEQHGSTD